MESYEIPEPGDRNDLRGFDLLLDEVDAGNVVELRRGGQVVAVVLPPDVHADLVALVDRLR
jgi:antitoxin (DNA-binding transcriptional repressor) of toxin-antitoxin stability system